MSKRRVMKLGFEGRNWSDLSILEARRVGQRITPYIMYPEDEDLRKLVSATSSAAYLKKLKAFRTKKVDGQGISDLVAEEQIFFDANGGVDTLIEALGHQTYKGILQSTLGERILVTTLVRNLIDLSRTSKSAKNNRLTPSLTRAIDMAIKAQGPISGQANKDGQQGAEARFELFFTKGANTTINAAWQQYINVAHLVYADVYESATILPQQVELAGTAGSLLLRAPLLPLTLSLSKTIQDFLISLKPKGGKATVVSADTVWRLPASLTKGLALLIRDSWGEDINLMPSPSYLYTDIRFRLFATNALSKEFLLMHLKLSRKFLSVQDPAVQAARKRPLRR